jgi:type III pantothenate kinase
LILRERYHPARLKFGLFVPSISSFYRRVGTSVSKVVDVAGEWPSCRRFLAIPVDDEIPWETLSSWNPEGTIIAGSNPKAVERVLADWHHTGLMTPVVIRDRFAIPVSLDVDTPEKVGLDRLLNAVAANALKPASRPAIVIDSGTATTVNFLSSPGVFCGGAILPGLEMSAKALHFYTAVLPLLPVQDLGGDTPVAPGRNTREAIRNGLFWGQIGAIRELVHQTCRQQGLSDPDYLGDRDNTDSPWMILTGGGGPVLSPQFPGFLALPSLGMHGLVLTAWKQAARLSILRSS